MNPQSASAEVIKGYVDAGFIVLTPGLRGHGTVDGRAAEGIEYLKAWDNRSYLSPIFYAIDVLNLLEGVGSLEEVDWRRWGVPASKKIAINSSRINIAGHSQGGDAVLTVAAIVGEGSAVRNKLNAISIWAGCFAPRTVQASFYGPMRESVEAFMAGDGTWNGTAIGKNGAINADFVFGFPSDWIDTVNPQSRDWSWQADVWKYPTVVSALEAAFDDMYRRYREGVEGIEDIHYRLVKNGSGRTFVRHDPYIAEQLPKIGGFNYPHYITEPLNLHHSDRDFYSPPEWNADLAARINAQGGKAYDFTYRGTTHSLKVSQRSWFSPKDSVPGIRAMIARDIALFRGKNPRAVGYP